MVEFEVLASSSAGCCYVLRSGAHAPLLLDAGIRFAGIQKGMGFRVSSLAGALVSHCHGDHSKGIPGLQSAGIDVYASSETWKALNTAVASHHRALRIDTGQTVQVGPWGVKPFDAVHDVPGTLGFFIGCPDGERFLYLTDSAYSRYTFPGVTHIAIECNFSSEIIRENALAGTVAMPRFARTVTTHMSLERLIQLLQANDLSEVQEIHLLHLSDENSDEAAMKRAVQVATGKPVYIAAKRGAI